MKREDFDRMYEKYYRLVTHIAHDILQDHALAQDVCQEVFVKFNEKIEGLDEDKLKGWMLRNAQRKTIDLLRKSYRKREISVLEEKMEDKLVVECMTELDDENCRREFRSFVLEELKEQNPQWYDMMVRVIVYEEPAKEVAADYGITVMNLRMKISRARRWLYKNYYKHYREL